MDGPMDGEERALLESSVRAAVTETDGPAGTDAALLELGWLELLDAAPADAVGAVFTVLGAANGAATVLDDVVLAALGIAPRPDLAVVLPRFGAWRPPGRGDGDRCTAQGLTTARGAAATELVVVCGTGPVVRAVTVPASSAELHAIAGVDPDAAWQHVRVEDAVALATTPDSVDWDAGVAWGQRAVAHQIGGACRGMLAMARTHASERVQFGRAIASFQAVRHRLADALVAVEALEATLGAAADEPNGLTAALAKATAARSARVVAAHCQQVLAGVGFTTDHPFHRYLKRTMLLEGVFGSSDEIALQLGRRLLADRRVPTLIEL